MRDALREYLVAAAGRWRILRARAILVDGCPRKSRKYVRSAYRDAELEYKGRMQSALLKLKKEAKGAVT